ncbi:MAG: hypothetical protein LQ340_004926 [Diploschistes diacapsis]|nr:MAG: hypothetical protein LQ340_004926 [Diploschistes diacapsis]
MQHGPICLATSQINLTNTTSEDCLFLDVYAPSNATAGTRLPVFVFIQGGGFNLNANPNFNGTGLILASQMNIVIVTFNYRVGPYGFLASQQVADNGNLNAGLLDQRKVFEWFGGDPDHVTIGGDSAGGASVDLHLSAYGGRDDGLFHAAAAESQSFGPQLTVSQSQYQYDALVQRTGCNTTTDSLLCLRNLPIEVLQGTNINIAYPGGVGAPLYMYSNVVDGDFTPDFTYNLFAQGRFIKVPVIFGDATNEGTIFTNKNTSSYADMNTFLLAQFPDLTRAQLARIDMIYPEGQVYPNANSFWPTVSSAYGEMRYNCPGIFISSSYYQYSTELNWNYHYDVHDPTLDMEGYGVTHTVEVNAIWGPQYVTGMPPASYNTTNAAIVPVMQGYWTSFIRSFNPNTYRAPGSPRWVHWNNQDQNRILLQTNASRMETVPWDQRERCSYLSAIGFFIQQ